MVLRNQDIDKTFKSLYFMRAFKNLDDAMNTYPQTRHLTMVGCKNVGRQQKTDLQGNYETATDLGADTPPFNFNMHYTNS